MAATGRSHEAGFTLIELLASLVVLGLLSLIILAGIGGRSVAWTRLDRKAEAGEAVEAAQGLVRGRLEHAWPLTLYNMAQPGPDFIGEAGRLVFLAPPPPAGTPGPLRRYQLSLDEAGDLVFDSLSDIALDQRGWSIHEVLLHGAQSVDFAYFGVATPDMRPAWRPSWRQQPVMPALVRIRVGFPEGDRRSWPDLIVHPMADIDTSCILVVATGGCRGR